MKWMSSLLAAFAVSLPLVARGADEEKQPFPTAGDESKNYQTEVIVEGLDNPSGLAIRPTGEKDTDREIFFAESGVGRVLRFAADRPSDTQVVIAGFESRSLDELDLRIGPSALGFLTPTKLAVLGGLKKDYLERVGLYVLPTDGHVLNADQLEHAVSLRTFQDIVFQEPVGFHGMIVGDTSAYFSNYVVNRFGDIYKASLSANRVDEPRRLSFRKVGDSLTAPVGLCLSPSERTQFLVASFIGSTRDERDSHIAFIIPSSGEVAMQLTPGLFDVIAVAYGPSGQLYAVDFAWQEEKEGGVYRLDDARLDGQPACRAVKIASLEHPTSLLFDASGNLYVTSLGTGSNAKHGKITKITGSF